MARRQFTGVRTPRRRKVWAREGTTDTGQLVTFNTIEPLIDLLTNLKTDLGVSRPPPGSTVMRIVGTLHPGNSASCTVNVNNELSWGIAWVPNQVALAAAGDAQIPDPSENGLREVTWLQKGTLFYQTTSGINIPASVTGRMLDQGTMRVDITQMRKQPTADSELMLIIRHRGPAGSAPNIWFDLNTMLALA